MITKPIANHAAAQAFMADEWIKPAKEAGMGYFVNTAKHHDGFAMYDSKVSDATIVKATIVFVAAALLSSALAAPAPPVLRDHYIDVRTYPDYNRRPWPMPGWHTFGDRVQLVGNRYVNADRIKNGGGSGRVFRPNYDLVRKPKPDEFDSFLREFKAADPKLFIWNLGGYIPDHHPGGYIDQSSVKRMIDTLGEQFLGSDIGEQDGRYVNVHRELHRLSSDPFEEYLKLHRFQLRVAEDHADKASLLTVMYNWHGPLRDGLVVSAAAECQNKGGVTNAQVQYAFLRGAARQFGVSLAGDLAVFTSWDKQQTSTALRRRYLFSQYQWNCAILSCEDAYGPSPIVRDFNTWMNGFLDQHPRPGPMQCPVAFLTDPFQGWMPAMSLSHQFRKHANQAYQPGDFLTHLLLDTIYPRYADNGMWKDESRATVPTPYGDVVEVIQTDCPRPVMDGYGAIILASDLPDAGFELREKLEGFAKNGGHILVTAANARRLWPEWDIGEKPATLASGSQVALATGPSFTEPLAFEVAAINSARIPGALTIATCAGHPLILEIPIGKGRITLLASEYGLNRDPRPAVPRPYPLWKQTLESSTELVQPYQFPEHVRRAIDGVLKFQQIFSVGNDQLAFITNRRDSNTFLIGLYNSSLTAQPFAIQSRIGEIESVNELALDNLAATYPFLPAGFESDGVSSDSKHIAAADVRFFQVKLRSAATARTVSAPVFAARPEGRILRVPILADLDRRLLRWPTFFQHFDGVILDWTEFRDIDADALKQDLARWMNRQRLRFVIDCRPDQAAALEAISATKDMLLLLEGARDLVFTSGNPEETERIGKLVAADPGMKDFRVHFLPPTQQTLLKLPGLEIHDALHDDWASIYSNLAGKSADKPDAKPTDRSVVSGLAAPLRPNLFLALRDPGSAERALKNFDPVWRNFAGVTLQSDLVWRMSDSACQKLGDRMKRRGLRIIVDYSDHLEGWTGVSFQNLDAVLRSPEIGVHARSQRFFDNIAAKLPLLGVSDVLIVESLATALIEKVPAKPDPQVAVNRAVLANFCQTLATRGVTVHLWPRPFRELNPKQTRALIDQIPGMKAAINLNANPNLTGGLAWAGNKLGMIVLGGGADALKQRNAICTSTPVEALMHAPLSLRSASLAGLPASVPWILDGDYQNPASVEADLKIISGLLLLR